MAYFFFHWHEKVVDHLAANSVTPEEFEAVVCRAKRFFKSRTTGNPVAMGWTDEGRFLVCVFRRIGRDEILPVTAFEPEQEE